MASNDSNASPFLVRLADGLRRQEGKQYVVLPNRRSLFVLQALLGEHEPIYLQTIDDLMQQLSGHQLIEPEELLVAFYEAYSKVESQPQAFDAFSSWAITFLGDVNDVDLHLGDLDALYAHIDDYHRTGASFDIDQAGPIEQQFLSFWERLPKYYAALTEALDALQMGYRGRLYRRVAELAQAADPALLQHFENSSVHWVGIIPGNPSERVVLDYLSASHIPLTLYADVDVYYTQPRHHEAGRLFREFPLSGELSWQSDLLAHQAKDITVHALAGTVAQVVRAKQVLDDLGKDQWPKAVVVVPDSSFIAPIIQLFDADRDRINITSGFPMRNTMIHRFVMSWMNLHANAITRRGERLFYHKHLDELLQYAVVTQWLSGSIDRSKLRQELVKDNVRFVPISRIETQMQGDIFGQQAFDLLFQWEGSAVDISDKMATLLKEWSNNAYKLSIARIEKRAMDAYIDKLKLLLSQFNELLPTGDVRALKRFVHRQIGFTRLYLEEPRNDALQVMGMLETRMIDFEHVIVLGASEDKLPGPPRGSTHIPFIHRLQFQLPSRRDTEALTAYHFYRLITRAHQLHLIYDSVGDEMSSGEPSRYILQLQEELMKVNPHVTWNQRGLEYEVQAADVQTTQIAKSDEVMEDLKAYLSRGLSPSGMNTFINSPLEFYYYYVLGIREEDEVEEEVEASTFGSIVHDVLELAYKPFVGKTVEAGPLNAFLKTSDAEVETAFLKKFAEDDIRTGRNLLKLEMAKDHVRRFIQFDLKEMAENGPVKLLYLEDRLGMEMDVDGVKVKLTGFADRIDERHGVVRIIDYKSGMVIPADLRYDPAVLPTEPKLSKALQLATYKFIYCSNHRLEDHQVQSYAFSMRNFTQGYQALRSSTDEGSRLMDTLADVYIRIVRDMLDPTQYFAHKAESNYTTF